MASSLNNIRWRSLWRYWRWWVEAFLVTATNFSIFNYLRLFEMLIKISQKHNIDTVRETTIPRYAMDNENGPNVNLFKFSTNSKYYELVLLWYRTNTHITMNIMKPFLFGKIVFGCIFLWYNTNWTHSNSKPNAICLLLHYLVDHLPLYNPYFNNMLFIHQGFDILKCRFFVSSFIVWAISYIIDGHKYRVH